jgi:hypothetical protein
MGEVFGAGGGFSATGSAFKSRRYKFKLTRRESLLNSFGFLTPELVAWELLPFSFVADWFIPIGTYLEALDFVKSVEGTYVRTDLSRADVGLGTAPNVTIVSGSARRKEISVTRTAGSIGTLSSQIGRPKFKNPLSVSHATSAIALLQSVFGGRR